MCKRALDVIVSVVSLLLLTPVLVAIGVLVLCALGRPVLLRQWRPGLHGRPFVIYKFRTMTEERDADGNLLPDEERVTRVGRFLRHTSLDELPELYNVVRGEMSLVGPRPLLMRYLGRYSPEQMRRHDIPPGITGWTQVNGRNALSWDEKFALDLWYVENQSLGLDLKILVLTVWKALKREGITRPGWATTEEFWGLHARPEDRRLGAELAEDVV
ncbi:MAG TPA: sugar transferase [Acidimicrobiales bacterium]|nr:sugar transferase [Acidimicrobiales bacterium]